MATEAVVTVATEGGSEVEEDGTLGETVAVATGPGATVVVVAMATAEETTEEDTNAASVKLLITEVPTCGLMRLSVTLLGWQWFLLAVNQRGRCVAGENLSQYTLIHNI